MGVDSPIRSPEHELPPQFGKYTILRHLATGGMADVYIARATGIEGFEKIVVIKRVRPELMGDSGVTEMFLQEARLTATLTHPNIAQVYEIGIVNGSFFFAMEYVPGADLRQLMTAAARQRRTVPLADAVHITIAVCAALHYAHEKRGIDGQNLAIIHRDVSPSNVLISHGGTVKVCDFGIAKARSRSTETLGAVLKGKASYMSPEQCRCERIDRRSDVFSIAILLYELSTLRRLFFAPSDFETMRKIVDGRLKRPSEVRADYPPDLERIVLKGLGRAPPDRYPTAQAMQLELEAFARDHKLATSSVGLAALMSELFEMQDQGLRERTPTVPAEGTPVEEPDTDLGDWLMDDRANPSTSAPTVVGPPRRPRRRAKLWLAGATAAAAIGAAAWFGMRGSQGAGADTARAALQTEAERLGANLDAALRASQLRADGIAASPILRAAIETDAATLQDLARDDRLFMAKAGETLEVFQHNKDAAAVSLFRMPSSGQPIPPIRSHEPRLERRGDDLTIVARSPILLNANRGVGGTMAIATPFDLAPSGRRLAERVAEARLTGVGDPIVLVDDDHRAPRGESLSASVPLQTAVATGPMMLEVAPHVRRAEASGWWLPFASWAAALAMLLAFAIGRSNREVESHLR